MRNFWSHRRDRKEGKLSYSIMTEDAAGGFCAQPSVISFIKSPKSVRASLPLSLLYRKLFTRFHDIFLRATRRWLADAEGHKAYRAGNRSSILRRNKRPRKKKTEKKQNKNAFVPRVRIKPICGSVHNNSGKRGWLLWAPLLLLFVAGSH